MRRFAYVTCVGFLCVASTASAQDGSLFGSGSGGLQLIQEIPVAEEVVEVEAVEPSSFDVEWVDVAAMMDRLRIGQRIENLRGLAVDPSGKNVGMYFASPANESFAVYRNGRLMTEGKIASVYELQEPVVFRMTSSGDLLYALHGTDLYVNGALVSEGRFSFSTGSDSVHEHGGRLTFPEAGTVVTYDIATGIRTVLYRHSGEVQYVRRAGNKIAYTVQLRGQSRMYRNGRRVSPRVVENPRNFAMAENGDVYFFTKAARGYALFRNSRSYVTGRGKGAYVAVDPKGRVWHISYVHTNDGNVVRLQRDRRTTDLFPGGVSNVELSMAFPQDGYAIRAVFRDDERDFFLVRDGQILGDPFLFEYPYGETHGFTMVKGYAAYRAHDGRRWGAFADGEPVVHGRLRNVWFLRDDGGTLVVYGGP